MTCPLDSPDCASVLLDYCNRTLNPASTAILERHIEICPACREFAEQQRAVSAALDSWEAAPVSADFNRRLYARLDHEVSWWSRLTQSLRPLMAHRRLPFAAAACLVLMAGILLQHGSAPGGGISKPDVAVMDVQPEQVEQALDAMDMLSEFSHKVRNEGAESKL